MPCYSPLQAYYGERRLNGKNNIVFDSRFAKSSIDLKLPCGQCVGCRLERSRQWAIRCMHEAQLYDRNCFITLTFNDKSLFERDFPMSLDVRDFQLFMKRLRKEFGNGIRYYACGEYGDRFSRPHYHACLFNFNFSDLLSWKEVNGFKLYTSEALCRLWPYGYSSVGSVTFESAAYVARYIMKKINGKLADDYYQFINFDTGEWYRRKPEFTVMSRRPGIGSKWFYEYYNDVYPNDYVVLPGRGKFRPPKFYDGKLDDFSLEEIKASRIANAVQFGDEQSPQRLADKAKVASARLALFSRNVE